MKHVCLVFGMLVLVLTLVAQADFTNALVGRWTFNGPDPLMDDIGANSSLTAGSGVTISNGQAIFDGTANAKLNAGTGVGGELDATPDITLWMRVNLPANSGVWNMLFDRWGPEWVNRPYLLYVRPDNNYLATAEGYEGWNGTQIVRKDGASIYSLYTQFGNFADIAFVWNHVDPYHPGYASYELYVNGTLFAWHDHVPQESAPATTGIWHDATQPLVFGSMLGTVEEIRVYNSALTDNQLGQIQYVPVPEPVSLVLLVLGSLMLRRQK